MPLREPDDGSGVLSPAHIASQKLRIRTPACGDLPLLGSDPKKHYRLGIMGGTFDPIHHGHLVCAETAFDALNLDVVVFMPAGSPAFKQHVYVSSGEDAIADIVRWKDAGNIADLAHLVGATRPGYDLRHAQAAIEESPYDFQVTYLEVPALAISSSYLRRRVEEGQSLRYLTPDAVTGYIHKHELYGAHSLSYGSVMGLEKTRVYDGATEEVTA